MAVLIGRGTVIALPLLALLCAFGYCASDLWGAEPQPIEYAVKATFLYKFTPFVIWPPSSFPSPDTPLTICVAGDDAVSRLIDDAAQGQRDGERPIVVQHLMRVAPDATCHVLYAVGTDAQPAEAAFDAVRGQPVLTVTDSARGPSRAIITFVVENNRVRFDIDDRAAAASGLSISSKLLSLARTVIGRG